MPDIYEVKQEVLREVLEVIRSRMLAFANIFIDYRRNAFDELTELSRELNSRFS